jgi:hypothetical protein
VSVNSNTAASKQNKKKPHVSHIFPFVFSSKYIGPFSLQYLPGVYGAALLQKLERDWGPLSIVSKPITAFIGPIHSAL